MGEHRLGGNVDLAEHRPEGNVDLGEHRPGGNIDLEEHRDDPGQTGRMSVEVTLHTARIRMTVFSCLFIFLRADMNIYFCEWCNSQCGLLGSKDQLTN